MYQKKDSKAKYSSIKYNRASASSPGCFWLIGFLEQQLWFQTRTQCHDNFLKNFFFSVFILKNFLKSCTSEKITFLVFPLGWCCRFLFAWFLCWDLLLIFDLFFWEVCFFLRFLFFFDGVSFLLLLEELSFQLIVWQINLHQQKNKYIGAYYKSRTRN